MADGYIEITGGGSRIEFDHILKWQPGRLINKSFEMGDIDGEGVVENSGQTLLKHKLTIEMITDDSYPASGKTALEKWDELDDFISTNSQVSQTLSITFNYDGGTQTITFVGKVAKGTAGGFTQGEPDFHSFSIDFSTESKGAIV